MDRLQDCLNPKPKEIDRWLTSQSSLDSIYTHTHTHTLSLSLSLSLSLLSLTPPTNPHMITINKQINQPVPSFLPFSSFPMPEFWNKETCFWTGDPGGWGERERKERRISALTTNLAFILLLLLSHPHSPKLFLPLSSSPHHHHHLTCFLFSHIPIFKTNPT